ncbi:uncharacterized protein LOC117100856 isoform X1 [Anneissia japonica]|uniref:uncharacterized protein LOC117100856 isoform X1 n=2 Tax=Anneissia japonica TaxID=1529436 RepID=UPI0014256786|nr:uncharacterized protein LOC117100856 isoform X1 [Anneissia japonica]
MLKYEQILKMAEPQFEDAFEDAESDFIATKPSTNINGTYNGTDTTNGDLPESQSSEGDMNNFIDADESEKENFEDVEEEEEIQDIEKEEVKIDVALENGYLEMPSRSESLAGVHEDMTESDSDRDIPDEAIHEADNQHNVNEEEESDTEDTEDHHKHPEGTEEVVKDEQNFALGRVRMNELLNGSVQDECTEDDLPNENNSRMHHVEESDEESSEEDEEEENEHVDLNIHAQDHVAGLAYKRAVVFPHQDAKCEDERGFSGVSDQRDGSESESAEADMECPEEDSSPGTFSGPVCAHGTIPMHQELKEDEEENEDEEEDQWEDEHLPTNMNYLTQQQYHVPSNGHRNDLFFTEKSIPTTGSPSEQTVQPPTPPPSPVPNSSNLPYPESVDHMKLQLAMTLDTKIDKRLEPQVQMQTTSSRPLVADHNGDVLVDVAPLAEQVSEESSSNINLLVSSHLGQLASSVDSEPTKRPKRKSKTKMMTSSSKVPQNIKQNSTSLIKKTLDSSDGELELIDSSGISKAKSEMTKSKRTAPGKAVARSSPEDGKAITRTAAGVPSKKPAGVKQSTILSTRMKSEIQFIQDIENSLAAESFVDADDECKKQTLDAMLSGKISGRYNDEYAPVSSVKKTNIPTTKVTQHDKKSSPKRLSGAFVTRPKKELSHLVQNNSNSNSSKQSQLESASKFPSNRPSEARKGDILFDDFAECSEYIKKKTNSVSESRPKDEVTEPLKASWRRRRNSYELANRDSSSDEEDSCTTTGSESTAASQEPVVPPKHYSILDVDLNILDNKPKAPSSSIDGNLLEKLAERELAHMKSLHVKNKTPSQFEDANASMKSEPNEEKNDILPTNQEDVKSTPAKLASKPKKGVSPKQSLQSPKQPAKVKLDTMISPMEYEKIGLRLAGHTNASLLGTPDEEGDQFSDAFEDADEDGEEGDVSVETKVTHHQAEQIDDEDGSEENSDDKYHNIEDIEQDYPPASEDYPIPKLAIDEKALQRAMVELEEAIVSVSRQKLRKVPSNAPRYSDSPWVLKPEVALKMEEDDRRKKIAHERQRRKRELELARLRQRVTLPDDYVSNDSEETPTVQCYQKEEDEENEEGLESRLLISGSDPDHTKPNFTKRPTAQVQAPDTMRAPDLPVTTHKVKESRGPHDEAALTKGIIYPAAYLGSTQLLTTKTPTKKVRMQQAQEAVGRIKSRLWTRWQKSPDGEEQPSTEVDLSISMDKIRVLNADTQETMMDHPLKTISYIADIGNIVVIMARRRALSKTLGEALEESGVSMDAEGRSQPRKIICHVFETEDAQLIAQTIGQAFSIAYLEFLKQNGIDDPAVYEMDYQDVLNSQEIYGDDLMLFSNKECEKEILVNKERGENMGVVIVESGWGSLIPTVVIANMSPFGAAARCGKLNIGDQIMSINGTSCVGLPLEKCQQLIKSLKSQALVKFNIVSCPPVTQVLVKRPDTRYQLGFSVQNGTICSLMRGGIAERGGVRVGHRIIEINGSSVVAVTHEKIVEMLSNSVGEIRMKTMPLSMYRLLTGQELPVYI